MIKLKTIIGMWVPIVIAITCYWNLSNFITYLELGHNMMESLMMGSAPIHGLGIPYKDYWGIYPPGIYMVMGLFEILFAGNVTVFKALHFLLTFGTLILFWKLLNRLFDKKYQIYLNLITVIAAFFYNSYSFSSVFASSVLMGNFLVLLGLWLLLFSKRSWVKYGISTAIFALAGSIKDPYQLLAIIPIAEVIVSFIYQRFISRKHVKDNFLVYLSWCLAGGFVILGLLFAYLNYLGLVGTYLEVMDFKKSAFLVSPPYPNNFEGTFNFFQLFFRNTFFLGQIFILLILVALFILVYYRKKLDKQLLNRKFYLVLFFCLLNFVTFKLQNRIGVTYSLQVIIPLFLLVSYLFVELVQTIPKRVSKYIVLFLIIILLLPKGLVWRAYYEYPPVNPFFFTKSLFSQNKPSIDLLSDTRVQEIFKNDKRILNLYGWGTPNFFYRYKAQPFNRFFIVHPNLMGEKQNREWVESFNKELPKIVKYGRGPGSDMNEEIFENSTIKIQKILEDCYTKINEEIYILPLGRCDKFSKNVNEYVNPAYINAFKSK